MTAAAPPSGATAQYTQSNSYDNLNRPINAAWDPVPAQAPPSAGANITFTHGYTKANQRVSQATNDNGWLYYPGTTPSSVSYTANALNQYTSVGGVAATYDANGNLTGDGTFTLGLGFEQGLFHEPAQRGELGSPRHRSRLFPSPNCAVVHANLPRKFLA